jgi:hypothetical protein
LWRINVSDLLNTSYQATDDVEVLNSQTSTSTPVASPNGRIYVGSNDQFTGGGVHVFDYNLSPIGTLYSGEPVQASPILYRYDPSVDMVYFTTNSSNGKGYCYAYDGQTALQKWEGGGSASAGGAGGAYASQGFAFDKISSSPNAGAFIYGDDSNTLYIFR